MFKSHCFDFKMTSFWFCNFCLIFFVCSILVAVSGNPITALVFLLAAFFSASAIFIVLKSEFIALTLILVYVGAIAILFLFIIMMFQIKNQETPFFLPSHWPFIGLIIAGAAYSFLEFFSKIYANNSEVYFEINYTDANALTSAHAFGQSFYAFSPFFLVLAGLILFIALVGAIVLTLNTQFEGSGKKQSVERQAARAT